MLSTQWSAGMVVLTASDGSARLLAIRPRLHLGPAPQNTSVCSETAAVERSVPHVLLCSPLNARNTLHVSPQSKDQRFLCCTRAVETFRSYCSCAGNRAEGRSSSSVTQRRICLLQWSCHAFNSGHSRFRTVRLISLGFFMRRWFQLRVTHCKSMTYEGGNVFWVRGEVAEFPFLTSRK